MELVKNPNHFEKGLPKLDGASILIIPEAAARVAALESGAIDILWNLPYESVDRFKNSATIRVDRVSAPTWDGVILNNARKPFSDVRVRQALAATIDKRALVELAQFGQGEPTFSPIPPSHPYFNKSLKFNPPDIAKAKKLLAEAGYPNGFDVPMQVPQDREQRVRLGVAVPDMARAADVLMAIPAIMLGLLVLAVTPPTLWKTALAVGLVYIPPIARLTRSVTLGLANEEFIQAAKARGEKTAYILFREILPNAWPPLIVEAGLRVTYAVLLGSTRA
jgi:hypothetical protein